MTVESDQIRHAVIGIGIADETGVIVGVNNGDGLARAVANDAAKLHAIRAVRFANLRRCSRGGWRRAHAKRLCRGASGWIVDLVVGVGVTGVRWAGKAEIIRRTVKVICTKSNFPALNSNRDSIASMTGDKMRDLWSTCRSDIDRFLDHTATATSASHCPASIIRKDRSFGSIILSRSDLCMNGVRAVRLPLRSVCPLVDQQMAHSSRQDIPHKSIPRCNRCGAE